jgi:hypothetical protein
VVERCHLEPKGTIIKSIGGHRARVLTSVANSSVFWRRERSAIIQANLVDTDDCKAEDVQESAEDNNQSTGDESHESESEQEDVGSSDNDEDDEDEEDEEDEEDAKQEEMPGAFFLFASSCYVVLKVLSSTQH